MPRSNNNQQTLAARHTTKHMGHVVVFGSSSPRKTSPQYKLAAEMGSKLAQAGFVVVNGGYAGTMEATSSGARNAGGRTIGVTCPSVFESGRFHAKPNAFLDEILPTENVFARTERMINLGDGFLVLEGGTGTLMELAITWEFMAKGLAPARPIVVLGPGWRGLIDGVGDHRKTPRQVVHFAENADDAIRLLQENLRAAANIPKPKKASAMINDDTATVGYLKDVMSRFVEDRDWRPFHDPKNLSASIAIEAAELMEHFQWLRTDELDTIRDNQPQMCEITEEIADVMAYVLSFAETMGIDLSSALTKKMVKNAAKYPAEKFRGRFK